MDSATVQPGEFCAWIEGGESRRAGDWLVRSFADEVVGLCTAMVRDRAAAEDLTQEVFARAFANLAGFRGDASMRSWLLTITRNRCIDHLRAAKRDLWRAGEESDAVDEQPAETPLPSDLLLRRGDVEGALTSLSEGERALIVLRFKNGLGYAELADAFGIREGTARMRVSRALAKMRAALTAVPETPMAAAALAEPEPARAPRRARACAPLAAPAPASPPAAAAPPKQRAGLLRRVFAGRAVASAASTPPRHSLADYFAATSASPSASLRERLAGLVNGL